MTILNLQVGASSDDCFRHLSGATPDPFILTETLQHVGAPSANFYTYGGGMRFLNVTVPQGAVIDQAYLTLRSGGSISGVVVNSRISADDTDNAVTFSTLANFDTRYANRTTARVDWDAIPAWVGNTEYDSPEIKTVIQEIVDRAGWASGNSLAIFWEDFDDRSTRANDCQRAGYSYDGSIAYAPKLTIIYSIATSLTVTTQAVTAISGTTATGNGNITSLGNPNPTQHGHCWNTTGTPTTADSKTQNGAKSAIGTFTSAITGLTAGTKYYVRAYATNTEGTSYGGSTSFKANYPLGSEVSGIIAVVETRLHYVDAYGVQRFIEGTIVT